ncbi:mediator of RNA polymerase II transcription subunit 13 [Elsinoe australis]|uniref:Mediator of RNA polymerase II transcription subunit 13 n=1 Tax=Elsinoe australis TaxID=40998 RepID=A0A4U7AX00_9PEZI|nr:mediator of RNA polymerase II transcription subunit 13 [Elsinoe australis]
MEFLRSCTSNVHLLHSEASFELKYDCYNLQADGSSERETAKDVLQRLRSDSYIATLDTEASPCLWLFHPKGRDDDLPQFQGLHHHATGSINALNLAEAVRRHRVESMAQPIALFFDAFSAYVPQILRTTGQASPVSFMTWILTSCKGGLLDYQETAHPFPSQTIALSVQFRVTPGGTIITLVETYPTNLFLASERVSWNAVGEEVVLAPFGFVGVVTKFSPRLDDVKTADSAWSWLVQRYPFLKQIDSAGSDLAWISVTLSSASFRDGLPSDSLPAPRDIVWPACLCLGKDGDAIRIEEVGWCLGDKHYADFFEPIKEAERWFLGAADRERIVSTEDKNMNTQAAEPPSERAEEDLDFSTSPLYNRNLEPGASNGVYPTPPDGIAPAHNPPTSSSLNAADMPTEEDQAMRSSPENPSRKSSIDMDLGEAGEDDDGNLFGDMEEDMFGNPDVTDADFNFFDQSNAARGISRQISPDKALPLSVENLGTAESSSHNQDQRSNHQISEPMDVSEGARRNSMHTDSDEVAGDRASLPKIVMPGGGDPLSPKDDEPYQQPATRADVATPPLSPVLVKDRLLESNSDPGTAVQLPKSDGEDKGRRFAPVPFKPLVSNASAKYKNGGRFANDTNPERTSSLGNFSKRNISLRDFLDTRAKLDDKQAKQTITSVGLRALRLDETDESDTDSVMSTDIGTYPASKRLAINLDGLEATSQAVIVDDKRTKPVDRMSINLEALDMLYKRWISFNSSNFTMLNTWSTALSWTYSLGHVRKKAQEVFWDMFDYDGQDLINIAQLAAEYDLTNWSATTIVNQNNASLPVHAREKCLTSTATLTGTRVLTLSNIATLGVSAASTPADQANRNGPRPTPRRGAGIVGGATFGQQLFPLSAPFVRIRRGDAAWDLLSSALNFWEALALEPSHGPKDISTDIITIGSDDLKDVCLQFTQDVQYVYETCKFGTHDIGFRVHKKVAVPSDSPGPTPSTDRLILTALREACTDLAKKLNHRYRQVGAKASVVHLFNPFDDPRMGKYVCASFQACLRELSPGARNVTLQMIPFRLIAASGGAVVPRAQQLLRLCLSTYDKVKPQKPEPIPTPWKLFCAPSISLVSPLPRKVNFALNETPPINLMQEAQVLHIAYAVSSDARWLNVAWTDYTGNHQARQSYCLYRADPEAVFTAVKNVTSSLMTSSATWRVIIACVGHSRPSERQIFANLNAANVAVSIVDVSLSPVVQIYPQSTEVEPPQPIPTTPALAQGASSLTPASTPQAASTVSPDAHHPPTPSSTDHNNYANQSQNAEPTAPDPDAHLVDTRDESFALVLPFTTTRSPPSTLFPAPQKKVLASGQLLKRGDAVPGQALPSLGVDVVEVLPPKIPQGQSSWMMPRAPEYVLREVLAWYRGLGLLGKIRGVKGCEMGERPWHVGVVVAGSEALEGFF